MKTYLLVLLAALTLAAVALAPYYLVRVVEELYVTRARDQHLMEAQRRRQL